MRRDQKTATGMARSAGEVLPGLLHSDIRKLAKQIATLRKRAAALGLFTDDRELLRCPQCGLQEDVEITGRLITYSKSRKPRDTGLRFKRLDNRDWLCPRCQTKIQCVPT
jgi:rubredoxin